VANVHEDVPAAIIEAVNLPAFLKAVVEKVNLAEKSPDPPIILFVPIEA
jgi:hypothetical protein